MRKWFLIFYVGGEVNLCLNYEILKGDNYMEVHCSVDAEQSEIALWIVFLNYVKIISIFSAPFFVLGIARFVDYIPSML